MSSVADDRRRVVVAGHAGDLEGARAGLSHADPTVRAAALGALERIGAITSGQLDRYLDPTHEPDAIVRRRAAEAAARLPQMSLLAALDDPDWSVVEMACWAIGEHEIADRPTLERLIELTSQHEESLVREAAVAALGAIGDPRGLSAIVAATADRAPVRRRAAVALAPFDEPEAEAALRQLLEDRDWQTRQIAEDLLDARPGTHPGAGPDSSPEG